MAGYSNAPLWRKMAFDAIGLGFVLEMMAMLNMVDGNGDQRVIGLEISGCALYVTCLYMMLQVIFLSQIENNIVPRVLILIMAFASGAFILAGIIIHSQKFPTTPLPAYPVALASMAIACVWSAGIFLILDLAKVAVPPCCRE